MMGDVECEARPSDRKKVVILGGGPNRIGQGIEFDYCCCHEGIPILGTTPDAIDLAEDRERFQALVNQLGLKQPKNGIASTDAEALSIAEDIGFPLVIRPSYVLGGRAMEIVRDMAQLERYIAEAVVVSGDSPVLLDSYLAGAVELDVDALCDGKDVHVTGIMQHIEEAGDRGQPTCLSHSAFRRQSHRLSNRIHRCAPHGG